MNPFRDLMKDRVSIVKADGRRFDDIVANVQPKKIMIIDTSIQVDEGDKVQRVLPNGQTESYLVIESGYHQGMHGIPASYQMEVRKESRIDLDNSSTIYNLHGANSRVNINSSDASVNIVTTTSVTLFENLKKAITEHVQDEAEQQLILSRIDDLEAAQGTKSFVEKYQDLITTGANHITILAPFIPALTQLLS